MRTHFGMVAATLCVCCVFGSNTSKAQEVRTAMVRDNQIAYSTSSGPTLVLTSDSNSKMLPVWSKDGSKIAYVESIDQSEGLAKLAVVNLLGKLLAEVVIQPHLKTEIATGMRYVESVEWLTSQLIAVEGGVNPSTTEYDVYDLSTRTLVKQFFDDGKGASFSPDGLHYAYVTGAPHFTPNAESAPTLNIDDRPVFRESARLNEFDGKPQWSSDSRSLAILALSPVTKRHNLVIMHINSNKASVTSVPSTLSTPSIFWAKNNVIVRDAISPGEMSTSPAEFGDKRGVSTILEVSPSENAQYVQESPNVIDPKQEAKNTRAGLRARAIGLGESQPDFWCEKCILTELARRSETR